MCNNNRLIAAFVRHIDSVGGLPGERIGIIIERGVVADGQPGLHVGTDPGTDRKPFEAVRLDPDASLLRIEVPRDHIMDFLAAAGYADFNDLARHLAKDGMHVPAFLFKLPVMLCLILHGFRLDKIRPIDAFSENKTTPVLFIHGKEDTFIPKDHSERMYEACRSTKRLCIFDDANHAESYFVNRTRYMEEVSAFLKDIGII